MFKLSYNFPFANFAPCLTINFQSLSREGGRMKNNKNYEKGMKINKIERIFYVKRSHKKYTYTVALV